MFRRFRVRNFLCLKDVTVDLEPLTTFVGPNSSGKSALFKALSTFCRLLWYPVRGGPGGDFYVEPGAGLDAVVWNGDTGSPITFEVWFADSDSEEPDYTLELRRSLEGWSIAREKFLFNGKWLDTKEGFKFPTSKEERFWAGPFRAPLAYLTASPHLSQDSVVVQYVKPIQDLRERLGRARRYRPSASDIASSIKLAAGTEPPEVNESGRGTAFALQDILTGDRDTFSMIEKELSKLHDHVLGMNFRPGWQGLGLFYRTTRTTGVDIPATLESDGVLLSTFLLWRVYSAPAYLKLCLEEPENGVHLFALKQRYQLLKRFATEQTGRPRPQILVSTHSRDFLNALQHESRTEMVKQVRLVEFSPTTGTSIRTLAHYREIHQLLDEFRGQIGDLWWSEKLSHKPDRQ
ncbi:MAG: AAA family ATPase [Chloroflexi bacterium]|nr:AAA family ATPase [Chloroflexota bacterium]